MKKIELYPGDSFHKLTVVGLDSGTIGRSWLCICECGKYRTATITELKRSIKQACAECANKTRCEKISKANKGKPKPWKRKDKVQSKFAGHRSGSRPAEWRMKISEALKGKKKSKTHIEKMSIGLKKTWEERRKNGTSSPSEEHRKNLSASLTGRKRSEETRAKFRECNRMERNPAWAGGVSYLPYPPEFNEERCSRILRPYLSKLWYPYNEERQRKAVNAGASYRLYQGKSFV